MDRSADDSLPTAHGLPKAHCRTQTGARAATQAVTQKTGNVACCTRGVISGRGRAWRVAADT